jgi:hypothetical protein
MPKTIYHIVGPEVTYTFLTKETLDEYANSSESDELICTSEVSDEDYEKIVRMMPQAGLDDPFDESLRDA